MWLNLSRLSAAVVLLLGAVMLAQESPSGTPTPEPPSTKPQFFSGTVTDLDHEHITVSRVVVGKAPETRTFIIKAATKVAKSLKAKAKVTVRYQHLEEDGDVALEIQIRSQWRFRAS